MAPSHESSGVVLRVLRRVDAPVLAGLLAAEGDSVGEWLPWPPEALTVHGLRRVIRDAAREVGRSGTLLAGIRRDGELVGMVGLFDVDEDASCGRLAYWVARAHRGRGVATAACRLLVSHAFTVMRLHALELRCAAGNASARAVAQRLGFRCPDDPAASGLVGYTLLVDQWQGAARHGRGASTRA